MAGQVAPRLSGDDYQHLYAWLHTLELLMPEKKVQSVTVEDPLAGSVDDVTVQYEIGTAQPDCFYQIKYHVDLRNEYSTDYLLQHSEGSMSLLQKFWNTWKLLQQRNSTRDVSLYLVSNWVWDTSDHFKDCISGDDNAIKDEFLKATQRQNIGKIRCRWQEHLNVSEGDFKNFVRSLRFKLGFDCQKDLRDRVVDRMMRFGLKSDESALLVVVGIVRGWITSRREGLTRNDFVDVLQKCNLYAPKNEEPSVVIYLWSIKKQRFAIQPDFELDWCNYFVGDEFQKGRQLKDPSGWNTQLLRELKVFAARVDNETSCRLIKARGLARLSPWFAFGHTFSEVARYTIEVDQQGQLWRTDACASEDFKLVTSNIAFPEGEVLDEEGDVVAVGLSVTNSLDEDVRKYLQGSQEKVAALLLLRPERELGRECLSSAGDVVALADGFKVHTRAFVKHWNARKLLLFYYGPLSGACFIGHRLNAVCKEIQIMEDQQPGYAPSFLIS
jgi:hypothetical protein